MYCKHTKKKICKCFWSRGHRSRDIVHGQWLLMYFHKSCVGSSNSVVGLILYPRRMTADQSQKVKGQSCKVKVCEGLAKSSCERPDKSFLPGCRGKGKICREVLGVGPHWKRIYTHYKHMKKRCTCFDLLCPGHVILHRRSGSCI